MNYDKFYNSQSEREGYYRFKSKIIATSKIYGYLFIYLFIYVKLGEIHMKVVI